MKSEIEKIIDESILREVKLIMEKKRDNNLNIINNDMKKETNKQKNTPITKPKTVKEQFEDFGDDEYTGESDGYFDEDDEDEFDRALKSIKTIGKPKELDMGDEDDDFSFDEDGDEDDFPEDGIPDDDYWDDEDDEGAEFPEDGEDMYDGSNNPGLFEGKKQKRKVRMTESKLISLIEKIVKESVIGLTTTKRATDQSKKDTKDYLNSVDKKLQKYLTFEGNSNPEFPKQNTKGEGKGAVPQSKEQEEYTEDYRGGGMQDLDYDHTPSKDFIDRVTKMLDGDSTMGNDQDSPNAIKSDLGERIAKNVERKKVKKTKEPMYKKDPQPIVNSDKMKNEEVEKKAQIIKEEIDRIKTMSQYNQKTQ